MADTTPAPPVTAAELIDLVHVDARNILGQYLLAVQRRDADSMEFCTKQFRQIATRVDAHRRRMVRQFKYERVPNNEG